MAIVFALLAAGANALATVFQRIGVEEATPISASLHSLMVSVLRRPIWFAGLALTTASFLLQATALALGDLSIVQPIMVTEIVFLVVILGTWFHHGFGWREWLGAFGTAAGLGVFLALSSSRGGTERPTKDEWFLLVGACLVGTALTWAAARRGSRSWRAACLGIGAGVAFALTAALIKTTADQWSQGLAYVFTHFEAYGVAVTGLVGFVICQNALRAGPIAASQSALLIVNPLASIIMGTWLFGDRVQASGMRGYFEATSLVVMFVALYVLSHSPLIAADGYPEELSTARRALTGIGAERWSD
jgi:drug/metabolite transporter (DMT)-like permease